MGAFQLSKWYMDCVSDDGEVVIAYTARLQWRSLTLHYASLLVRPADGGTARTETSMRATDEPALAKGGERGEGDDEGAAVLSWAAPALGFSGRWTSSGGPSPEATIFEEGDGKVEWRCHQPRARAEITLGDRVIEGFGYTEHLVLTVEPWRMPIDALRWGRFVGKRSSLVWIDWSGGHSKQLVLLDGDDIGAARIDDASVVSERGDVRLSIEAGGSLRRGAIGTTALARVPGIDRFPARILAVDEQKWCARGALEDAQGRDEGWVIHEVVRWPAAAAATEAPQRSSALGKLLYAVLFVAVLPALLVLWARSTEHIVRAPAWHAPTAGATLAGAGAILMVAGWAALWRHGGGLPMNAFPPPRFVTRGVYALVAHPIYVGFGAICFGASIAVGSASGLWLVSPAVALGAVALVLGYERHDLDARFGRDRAVPWLALPPPDDSAPSFARRMSAFVLAFLPWLLLIAMRPTMGLDAAGVVLLAITAPLAPRTHAELRTVVIRSLLAMLLVLPLHALVPAVHPSLLAIAALLAADAWRIGLAARLGPAAWLAPAVALLLARSDHAPGRPGVAGIAASVVAYVLVVSAGALWRGLRALTERVANSWHETRIGPVRIINHGLWAGLASFGGIVIIGTLLGPGPGHFATIVVGAAGGLIGAGLWAQVIEGSAALSRPYGFYGGLLGICLAGLAAPLLGTPIWLLLGSVAVSAPFIQGVGRMRCLVQGCCHGSETTEAVGIRVHHPRSRVCRLAHLDNVPIHATPLYSILWNAATFPVLARLWSLHMPLHFIGGVYLILNGLGRFAEEAFRGEPQTPILARLRLYQWVALVQVAAGALITAVASSPAAPPPQLNVPGIIAAAIFGVIYWFALGVDFPESNRRFSRLA